MATLLGKYRCVDMVKSITCCSRCFLSLDLAGKWWWYDLSGAADQWWVSHHSLAYPVRANSTKYKRHQNRYHSRWNLIHSPSTTLKIPSWTIHQGRKYQTQLHHQETSKYQKSPPHLYQHPRNGRSTNVETLGCTHVKTTFTTSRLLHRFPMAHWSIHMGYARSSKCQWSKAKSRTAASLAGKMNSLNHES